MHQHHCIFPYEHDQEKREALLAKPVAAFESKRITLYCTVLSRACVKHALVSRGQCIGFMQACPVYVSINGRVERIEQKCFAYNVQGYAVHIERENHSECTWSEILYDSKRSGIDFLNQMGLVCSNRLIKRENIRLLQSHVLWIDSVDSNPGDASGYRLMVEETAKVLLGADILATAFFVDEVVFCIENTWSEVEFLLEKYMRKYAALLSKNIKFNIKKFERRYPMIYQIQESYVFKPQIAIHAYNACYEHLGVVDAWVSVSGQILKSGNFKVPIGTHIADLLMYCGYQCQKDIKVIENSLLNGRRISEAEDVVGAKTRCLIVQKMISQRVRVCTGCGACARVCPMYLTPNALTHQMMEKCIHCGCCSYVCPSNQRLSEYARRKVALSDVYSLKRKKENTDYIELTEQIADKLPMLVCQSDAPPHIHAPKRTGRKIFPCNLYFKHL